MAGCCGVRPEDIEPYIVYSGTIDGGSTAVACIILGAGGVLCVDADGSCQDDCFFSGTMGKKMDNN